LKIKTSFVFFFQSQYKKYKVDKSLNELAPTPPPVFDTSSPLSFVDTSSSLLALDSGFRNFANKTFANYWRKSRARIGESSVELRQLANVPEINWRKCNGHSPIGESSGSILAKVESISIG
jgi:hypothetical protein